MGLAKPVTAWWKMSEMTEMAQTAFKFYAIAPVSEVPEGERLFFELEGQPIVLFSSNDGFYATGDVCSHDGGDIGQGELDGFEIICPRHGARFDIRTGRVLQLPAVKDIPHYPVRVTENGLLEVGIPTKN